MFSLTTLKKISKTALLSVVVFVAWLIVPTVASAQLFTAQSGVGRIKTVNWSAAGNDTFDVVTGFQFEQSDTPSGKLWEQIYQRVNAWSVGLYYGPTKDAGSFIIRTYESDSAGNPLKPLDADKNPQDTLITMPEQSVRYTTASAFLSLSPIDQASNIAQSAFGLSAESPTTLSSFYKYPTGDNGKVGTSEIVETQIKTKNKILPGGYVTVDFWYCPQREYDGANAYGTVPKFIDLAPGLVIDARSQNIDGITRLRSSSTLFPDEDFAIGDIRPILNSQDGGSPCASYLNAEGAHGQKAIVDDDDAASVVHGTYFRIGNRKTYQVPSSAAQNTTEQQNTNTELNLQNTTQNQEHGFLPGCGVFDSESSIMGCIAQGVYYIIYVPIQWFAGILGQLFDFFLGYSLSDSSYRAQFAVRGWQIVRDLSNIFFIIILIYTGLMAVFSNTNNMKKVVPQLILNALLINFSLFGTRVIIDISNVVARVFYKSVHVCTGECKDDLSNIKQGPAGYTPLSEKILSAFNPQQLMSVNSLDQAARTKNTVSGAVGQGTEGVSTSYNQGNTKGKKATASTIAGYFIIVSLIAALIMFGIAMMFWKTAFFFLGRVIGLYIAMIFAPFAVLSRSNMPIVSGVKKLSWSTWSEDLIKYAMLAPVFVFFLYIIYSFLDTNFLKVTKESIGTGSFFLNVLSVAIPMLIVYYMIKEGVKIAEDYAGDFGKKVTGFMNKTAGLVGGAALGVATGGVALAGRNVLGRLGARVAESTALQNTSARGGIRGWLADKTMQVGSGMSRATYDARNTSLPRTLQQNLGVGITNSGVGRILGTNTNRTAGGFREAITRSERELVDRGNRLQVTGQQARNMDAANSAWENAYQGRRNTAQAAALAAGQVFNEAQFRFSDMRAQAAAGNARPRSSAETNRRRERTYQATLGRGTVLSRAARQVTNRFTAPAGAAGTGTAIGGAVAGSTVATLAGGSTVAAAAVIGQGAIQDAARQNVIASRRNQARPTVSGGQRTRMLNQLAQLQRDQLRVYTTLSNVVISLGLPVTPANVNGLSVIDVQNYQAQNPQHGMASPNTVIAERNRINNDIANVRTQLGI